MRDCTKPLCNIQGFEQWIKIWSRKNSEENAWKCVKILHIYEEHIVNMILSILLDVCWLTADLTDLETLLLA